MTKIRPDRILECVADKCAVKVNDITGLSRVQNIREARFLYCLITRELTGLSYRSIGNYVNRSYCAVMHAEKRAIELINAYLGMKSLYNEIKNEITLE